MSRSTIEFNETADKQLQKLSETLGIKSKAEVVRNALSVYAYLVRLLQEDPGRALGIVNEREGNRIEKVIIVPGIAYAPDSFPAGQASNGKYESGRVMATLAE